MFSKKVKYGELNARQKEIYNFQKASALFAEYGYTTIKLSDDWMGADFIAISFDGSQYLKVQLKGRLTFDKKYIGKGIFICFCDQKSGDWYIYDHDKILAELVDGFKNTDSWKIAGGYSCPGLKKDTKELLEYYKLEG